MTRLSVPAVAVGILLVPSVSQADQRVYRAEKAPPSKGLIVNGAEIRVGQAPWQVRVEISDPTAGTESFCGGSIVNATTIVTAAHCTVADTGLNVVPGNLAVDAGVSGFAPDAFGAPAPEPGDTPQQRGVTLNRVHPQYPRPLGGGSGLEDFESDVAVLTLASPLTFTAAIQPIPLTPRNVLTPIGAGGTVTGFGSQTSPPTTVPNGQLFQLGETTQDDSLTTGPLNALFVSGISPTGSACTGDSGGPLVVNGALIGIVSNGSANCEPNAPNNYTDVSAGEIRDFVEGNDNPPLAPRGGEDVSLTVPGGRPPQQGDTLTCSPGTWANAPTFSYEFTDSRDGRVLQSGPSSTYAVTGTSDAGATISCRAIAANDGGVGRTPPTEGASAVTAAPSPPPAPTPTPTPSPTPTPTPTPDVDDDLSLSVASSATRVRRGSRVTFTLTLRNRGDRALTGVRQCATLSSRYTVVSRGGGRVSGGKICWSESSSSRSAKARASLRRGGTFRTRFTVRIDRDASVGSLVQRARATSSQRVADAGSRTIRVLPAARRAAPRPPGVTG